MNQIRTDNQVPVVATDSPLTAKLLSRLLVVDGELDVSDRKIKRGAMIGKTISVANAYATCEGLRYIYRGIEGADPEHFAEDVIGALHEYSKTIPEWQSINHEFLLHGLNLGNHAAAVAKLNENAGILISARSSRAAVLNQVSSNFPILDSEKLVRDLSPNDEFESRFLYQVGGGHDNTDAVTFFLYPKVAEFFEQHIACLGAYFDEQDGVAYILNLQGPKSPLAMIDENSSAAVVTKEYQKWEHRNGAAPKAYLVAKVLEFARNIGFDEIRGIKPEQHPYAYSGHDGFMGNYLKNFQAAGIVEDIEGIYVSKAL